MENRPQGREKHITGQGKPIGKRGSGLGTGPVGNAGGYSGKNSRGSGNSGGKRDSGGSGGGLMKIIILLAVLLFGGGSGLSSLLGGESTTVSTPAATTAPTYSQTSTLPASQAQTNALEGLFGASGSSSSMMQGFNYSSLFGSNQTSAYTGTGTSWATTSNTGKLNTKVDSAARAKYTKLQGNGKDTVTIMLYLCGTDLESKSAMASKDLQEMVNATIADNVNLIIFTGGCSRWQNSIISKSVNQIYQVKSGGLVRLQENAGNGVMTKPATLSGFIQYCSKNFPANRNILILWDHGGGSISGYGYDEKAASSGAMNLKGLDEALTAGNVKFDFIGFDACLMGTLETGLTMADHADYLIASEETEPGVGWYYTNWLTALSKNTSISTLELGKQIVDDFVSVCAQSCAGQKTTLSLVDLSELEKTVPQEFKEFSQSMLDILNDNGYRTIASARSSSREFATSAKTDQVDLVHLALQLDTEEGKALADRILSAVKYNKTSSNMTNAYGVSLYFPYQKMNKVSSAVAAYDAIGMDDTYSDCIRRFATMESGGQAAAGGTTSPTTTLSGGSYGSYSVGGDLLTQLLEQMLGGGSAIQGLGLDSATSSFFDRNIDTDSMVQYLDANRFDSDAMVWTEVEGGYTMQLSESQWSMIQDLELNVFVDDGEGYIDLGLDNTFDFTTDGRLIGAYDGSWLAIDEQNIAYYHVDTTVDESGYTITGRVPVLLNGARAELILVFSTENPMGYIAGARMVYLNGETDTVAKAMTELNPGDEIDFLCDYYTYDGEYVDSYMLGETHIYTGEELVSNVYLSAPAVAAYRLTDIYNVEYWTPTIP